jgi:diguanylate cyclase
MTIEAVINKVLADLKTKRTNISPDEFRKAFCFELKKSGITHEDCEKVAKYSARLSENYQKMVKSYGVKDEDDLMQLLLSQINRLNPAETEAYLESQMSLVVRVLKAMQLLKNKDATNLAKTSIDRIENYKSLESLANLKQKWDEFNSSYNDGFLEPLEKHCKLRKGSFDTIVEDVVGCFDRLEFNTEELAFLFMEAIKPSISKKLDNELSDFNSKISKEPALIKTRKVQKELQAFISRRIFLDNKEVRLNLEEIDRIVDIFSQKLVGIGQGTMGSHKKIGTLKNMLSEMRSSDDSFDSVKTKLVTLADAINSDLGSIVDAIKDETREIAKLKSKVKELEVELKIVKEESTTDQLTKLSNRKSIDEELIKCEEYFDRFKDDYAVVMFDIDHFKNVNDTFGHMAGDTVLASFAQILKKNCRDIDFVGRWGGEEFIAILHKNAIDEGVKFANKIRESVERTKFIFKDNRIPVTLSAGVCERKEVGDVKDALKLADKRLYDAKHGGRNRVEPIFG